VGEKAFTGGENDHETIGKDAAAYYIARIKTMFEEEPERWLQAVRPKGTQKALGFARDQTSH